MLRHIAVNGGQLGGHIRRRRRYKDEALHGAMVVVFDGDLHEVVDKLLVAQQVVGVVGTAEQVLHHVLEHNGVHGFPTNDDNYYYCVHYGM